jgi:mannose-6-phosphate isomerase-like protein (cupin superfamily)
VAQGSFKLTPHESVVVKREEAQVLEVEARWEPDGSPPPKHFHPGQDEHFEVLEGVLQVEVDGVARELRPGQRLDVPRGAVHRMWNAGAVPARAVWQTKPAGRTRAWFETLDRLQREGRVGPNGMPGPVAFGVYLTEFDDVIRLAGPQPVLRGGLKLLSLAGPLRGYPRSVSAAGVV